ncbi:AraC family transcriptional regulator [Pseudomonas sp. HR96]|uniref:AraC family transcriptional regulator n=1 Tax=Pseudomonas sp. HR96 TaxID=1027966 RepID=UPI002A753F3D|nr:AraC family transcriptional regulator [Pseudomonas sp. HR96]WPP00109.1 AraC family transcriptional regulator [Pseudomonas sp. HR96]
MSEVTTLASWTHALRRQLDALGLDSAALCANAGIEQPLLDETNACHPLAATTRLWQLAVQASGDPAIGLRVSRFVSPSTFHGLGYGLVASDNLREVFERIVRHHQVVGDALTPSLQRLEDRYTFCLNTREASAAPAAEAIDALAATCLRTCRSRLGRHYAPLAVSLTRPPPLDPSPWHNLFRSPIAFGAVENCLEFALDDFEAHLDEANPELAQGTEAVVEKTLGMLQPLTWERRVRAAIEARLPLGVPDAEDIAASFNVGLRSLQRHLADEGCRYDSLLDECRQNLALNYLREPDTPLAEIGRRLGFADAGSFNRAFRLWTGLSPAQFRNGSNL